MCANKPSLSILVFFRIQLSRVVDHQDELVTLTTFFNVEANFNIYTKPWI